MGKLFCLMGKSASGKDTLYQRLLSNKELGLKKVVPYTTRPIRCGEENGKEYFFVDDKIYNQMKKQNEIIESRTYMTVHGPWHYFTANDGQINLQKGSFLLIGTLEVYDQIRTYFNKEEVIPLYIEVEDGVRLQRALDRERKEKNPNYKEMCRRFCADCEDFAEDKIKGLQINKRYENINADLCYQTLCEDIMKYCTSKS